MHQLIKETDRMPHQRTTLYGEVPPERVAASFRAAPLAEAVNRPPRRYQGSEERQLVRFG